MTFALLFLLGAWLTQCAVVASHHRNRERMSAVMLGKDVGKLPPYWAHLFGTVIASLAWPWLLVEGVRRWQAERGVRRLRKAIDENARKMEKEFRA
jgi:hypothetical protein